MLVQQYLKEFNKQAKNIKFLSYTDEVVLSNKLKSIQSQFSDITGDANLQEFFSNLYHLLCQSSDLKTELLDNCLDILLTSITSNNVRVHDMILADFRFLPLLIGSIAKIERDNESKLIKVLKIIREMLSYSSELDERNLKYIVEVLKDHINHNESKEVNRLCFYILANLCLVNHAAKYLIARVVKTSAMKQKIQNLSDDLISFKFFILLEDEYSPSDFEYFLKMSIKNIQAGIIDFNINPVTHSLDIVKHFQGLKNNFDFRISEKECLQKYLNNLCDVLIERIESDEESSRKEIFFENIFDYLNILLKIDNELKEDFNNFTNVAFLSADISKSAEALNYLSNFVECEGSLKSSEIVIENILEFFITENNETQQRISFKQKYSLLNAVISLKRKEILSELHFSEILKYFEAIIESMKRTNLSTVDDEEVFLFIHCLSSLAFIAKTESSFYGLWNIALNLDYLPLLVAKAHLTRNEDILEKIFNLMSIENFPKRKVISLLSKSGAKIADGNQSKEVSISMQCRENEMKSFNFIDVKLRDELHEVISRINEKLDNDEIRNGGIPDIIQLYRQKIENLNDTLATLQSNLNASMKTVAELQQQIVFNQTVTEKQEFANWCLHLDNGRLIKENEELLLKITTLKSSLSSFQQRIDKEEMSKVQNEKKIKIQAKEIEQIKIDKAQVELKLHDMKAKVHVIQKENETRISELKKSLENEKKLKDEELAELLVKEQKKFDQKNANASREIQRLHELVKMHENEIVQKQEKIQQYEIELKDCEQMKNTIMSMMQTRSFKK
ncbi:CLUMA_CG004683, isoform A [Clunio marinus]|uniref:CLUMA_CG004683, isoform A n=1 Tax=Clunio marinus TaxID=568069 RepID=A0A1J1HSN0_9DIPT|nr:CLUMA_CG004683, isoform A [Clunio marinus]